MSVPLRHMKRITLDEVLLEVGRIKAIKSDDEAAHCKEDDLHVRVLRYYADGGKSPAFAKEALKTTDIDFARWCA